MKVMSISTAEGFSTRW